MQMMNYSVYSYQVALCSQASLPHGLQCICYKLDYWLHKDDASILFS